MKSIIKIINVKTIKRGKIKKTVVFEFGEQLINNKDNSIMTIAAGNLHVSDDKKIYDVYDKKPLIVSINKKILPIFFCFKIRKKQKLIYKLTRQLEEGIYPYITENMIY